MENVGEPMFSGVCRPVLVPRRRVECSGEESCELGKVSFRNVASFYGLLW